MATLRARKRGRGDAGAGAAAVLGALGLGGFAGLDLHRAAPAGEAELEQLAAAYDRASGRISVSIRGAGVSASPADLAVALGLPLGPAALGPEVDASVFLSEEAIAAVRGFLRDRVLLGGGGGGGRELPGEAAVALRLVEEGKAYAVDWCRLFWELLKMDLVSGKPRRYAPHLLRLIEYQRPELFAEVDGSSPLGKRRKSAAFSRQCQWEDEKETDLIDAECGDSRTQAAEAEVERSSQSIGDLEEMPVFGERKQFNAVDLVGYKSSIVGLGEWIHGVNEGNAELGSQKSLPSEIEVSGCEMGATKRDILEDLGARHVMISQFEHDIELMRLTIQQYRKLFENTSAAYLEYRNRMSREEGDGSSLEVIGIADETEQFVRMQQLDIYQRLNKFQKLWLTKYSDLVGHLTRVAECMTYLSNGLQRLKDSTTIPDLNNGKPQL
uniref:Uncharacterized protein n=1 Tax=Oryza nivara TaxID=4536 RepID=A0A0E0FTB3_ORYNI